MGPLRPRVDRLILPQSSPLAVCKRRDVLSDATFRGRVALRGRPAAATAVAAGAYPRPALGWIAPASRAVLGVVVEGLTALAAGLEARPSTILLRREHGRE